MRYGDARPALHGLVQCRLHDLKLSLNIWLTYRTPKLQYRAKVFNYLSNANVWLLSMNRKVFDVLILRLFVEKHWIEKITFVSNDID